jgi:hypothetical protein
VDFLFQGVFGNKSFGKNEEAKFIITLQIPVQKYNFDLNERDMLYEFGSYIRKTDGVYISVPKND